MSLMKKCAKAVGVVAGLLSIVGALAWGWPLVRPLIFGPKPEPTCSQPVTDNESLDKCFKPKVDAAAKAAAKAKIVIAPLEEKVEKE